MTPPVRTPPSSSSAAPAADPTPSKRRRITLRLRPRDASTSAAQGTPIQATPPPPRRNASPLTPADRLFLGDSAAQSPVYEPPSPGAFALQSDLWADAAHPPFPLQSPDYTPTSPTAAGLAAALADLDDDQQERHKRRRLAVGLSREAQESRWGEVYWTPPPEPAAGSLDDPPVQPTAPASPVPRAATPVYQRDVQRLTPPRRDQEARTPSPPPPSYHVPTHAELAGWTEQHEVVDLLVRVAEGRYPRDWDVWPGSLAEQRLQRIVMKRLTEGCMPWPSWQCRHCADLGVPCFPSAFANPYGERSRKPRTCTTCYLADRGRCVRNISAYPGIEYLGDGTPSGQPGGRTRVERANLTAVGARGPGWVQSYDRTQDPTSTVAWGVAMGRLYRMANRRLVQPLLRLVETFVTRWDSLYSKRQPHESTTESGGPPDPLEEWVYPTDMDPSNYIDM
ncbi:uncharacterized protein UTRI_06323 [Ustilago trichophora]|uniref:Uncharacterized protein n=1 Tax=Ustilago trichophora TaxID=86804 RepID=A0A5C3EIH8_9BASI|nr:uncharacterized protein UTRI_06323 [Ustilago trichophora]